MACRIIELVHEIGKTKTKTETQGLPSQDAPKNTKSKLHTCYPNRFRDKTCDFCDLGEPETIAHILNRCGKNKGEITVRSEKAHQPIKEAARKSKRTTGRVLYGSTIKEEYMKKIPKGFKRRPKPDMCILRMKGSRRGKVTLWDWKSPTEGHQKEAEEMGAEHYQTTASELKASGWPEVEIVIQSVTSLGYIPRDYRKKFKKIGIRAKEAVRVIKKVHVATLLQS